MNTNEIARIASLVGEPARTAMLLALMDGRALTANELAGVGNVSPATASRHLAQLVQAGLLQVAQQGRHRYHRLASAQVAQVLEGIMQLAQQRDGAKRRAVRPGPRDEAMRWARSCYDHLAGRLGVAITDHLLDEHAIAFDGEAGHLTEHSTKVLARLGLDAGRADAMPPTKRVYCRPCLDWSERRFHVAGRLGAMICAHCMGQGWLLRRPGTRALLLTARGGVALRAWLGHARWDGLAARAEVHERASRW
jgi:DNA-binding transcriptional ArsR family regulator